MKKQTFENHIRYYIPHHFVYYPIIILLGGLSIYHIFTSDDQLIWTFISAIFIVLFSFASKRIKAQQNINAMQDYGNVKIDDMTDAQIRQFVQQANASGLGEEKLEQIAKEAIQERS